MNVMTMMRPNRISEKRSIGARTRRLFILVEVGFVGSADVTACPASFVACHASREVPEPGMIARRPSSLSAQLREDLA